MASSETKSSDKKDRDRDKYLRKNYNITLDQYNAIGESQGWKCAICGRPASDFNRPLCVDHEHFRVEVNRADNECDRKRGWIASTQLKNGINFMDFGPTKEAAMNGLKKFVMPHSLRGLLCPGRHGKAGHGCCNRLLGHVDETWWLEAADAYLKNPPARKIIS